MDCKIDKFTKIGNHLYEIPSGDFYEAIEYVNNDISDFLSFISRLEDYVINYSIDIDILRDYGCVYYIDNGINGFSVRVFNYEFTITILSYLVLDKVKIIENGVLIKELKFTSLEDITAIIYKELSRFLNEVVKLPPCQLIFAIEEIESKYNEYNDNSDIFIQPSTEGIIIIISEFGNRGLDRTIYVEGKGVKYPFTLCSSIGMTTLIRKAVIRSFEDIVSFLVYEMIDITSRSLISEIRERDIN